MRVLHLTSVLFFNLAYLLSGSFCLADTNSTQTDEQELYVLNFDQVPELREVLQAMADELKKTAPERYDYLKREAQAKNQIFYAITLSSLISLTSECTRGKEERLRAAYQFIIIEQSKTPFIKKNSLEYLKYSLLDVIGPPEYNQPVEGQADIYQKLKSLSDENLNKHIFLKATPPKRAPCILL